MAADHMQRVRIGILALPLSGLLFVIFLLLRGRLIDPLSDPMGFATTTSSATFPFGAYGLVVCWLAMIFGFLALYAFLYNLHLEQLGFGGMVLSILGVGLYLPILGIVAAIFPETGAEYMKGEEMVFVIVSSGLTQNMTILGMFIFSIVLHSVGCILFAIAIVRCPTLPTWAGFLFATSAPLLHFGPNYWLEFAGAGLLLITGVAIALGVFKYVSAIAHFQKKGKELYSPPVPEEQKQEVTEEQN
jgi:MFS family permease